MFRKKLYRFLYGKGDRFVYPLSLPSFVKALWEHPVGPRTVFFWSSVIKWGIPIAGITDLTRPAHKLSIYQNTSLCVSGAIWTRYSLVTPINYNPASLNFFIFSSSLVQLSRIAYNRYMNSNKKKTKL